MQKGLGIAALVLAIVSISIPVVGPWITVLSAMMAAFAYGSASALGIASIVINIVNIIFLSPSLWIHGALVSAGAEMHGQKTVFLPWIVLGAQAIASMALLIFHMKSKSALTGETKTLQPHEAVLPIQMSSSTVPTKITSLAPEEVSGDEEIPPEKPNSNAFNPSSVTTDSAKYVIESRSVPSEKPGLVEAVEPLKQLLEKSGTQWPKVLRWAIPLSGIIGIGLLGYLGYSLHEIQQELERVRAEKEAHGRIAEQQTQAERQARREAQEQALAERRTRQEAEAQQAAVERKSSLEIEAKRGYESASSVASVDAPRAKAGDTYIIESLYPDNLKLNNTTERKVISAGEGKITVVSKNIKSKIGSARTIQFTPEWNLISSRNPDGSGVDYSPPLKYFEFPLYPGKTWRQTSIEKNIKTGAVREHTLSATVGDWENVSVPAGTFRTIKSPHKQNCSTVQPGKEAQVPIFHGMRPIFAVVSSQK